MIFSKHTRIREFMHFRMVLDLERHTSNILTESLKLSILSALSKKVSSPSFNGVTTALKTCVFSKIAKKQNSHSQVRLSSIRIALSKLVNHQLKPIIAILRHILVGLEMIEKIDGVKVTTSESQICLITLLKLTSEVQRRQQIRNLRNEEVYNK